MSNTDSDIVIETDPNLEESEMATSAMEANLRSILNNKFGALSGGKRRKSSKKSSKFCQDNI